MMKKRREESGKKEEGRRKGNRSSPKLEEGQLRQRRGGGGRGNSETRGTQENEGRVRDRQGRTVPKSFLSFSCNRRLGITCS